MANPVFLTKEKIEQEVSGRLASSSAAVAFSAESTYSVGQYVTHEGILYRCTTAHTGAWDAAHFAEECLTQPDANLVIDDETGVLEVVDAGGKKIWSSKAAAEYDVNAESSDSPAADSVQYLELADSTKSLTIPSVAKGKVCDFIVDVHATAECTMTIANISNITVVVTDGVSLANDILTFKEGEYARVSFTGCAFKVNNKPTYHVTKVVVVDSIG